jgi:hypothetical protein
MTAIERAEAVRKEWGYKVGPWKELRKRGESYVSSDGHTILDYDDALVALVEEAVAREREIERLQEAGSMLYTLLFRAWLFKGYSNGPLMEPATEMGMKDWLAAQSEQGE